MQPSGNNGVVRYTILDEVDTGGVHLLLFGCEDHPDKKLTSHMLESHMWSQHSAGKFTVSLPPPITNQDAVKDTGKSMKEVIDNVKRRGSDRGDVTEYNRPVPGPRQPRRD